ncbi:MAG: hypothetical protein Q8R90_02500 [Bacteroidales bacterium]|nr:hypothetical protein [Bacteroidales bacterium]
MKILPSIAFNDFSGSAGNVTARKTGDNTYLSTRTKHSKKKTTYQAATRCRFADTTRGYSKVTEEERQGWISLAKNLGSYHTSTGKASITGHNLFVAINSYRKICGKPQTAIAPSHLRPSDYIRLDDWWLSPEYIVFTGLGERANKNEVLYVEMYPAQSPAENRCWDKTVLVAIIPTTDWGDIDLTKAFIEKFGSPLTIGQKVFIKICWIDSDCGYIKNYTLIVREAQEASLELNIPYKPRAKITIDQIETTNEESLCEYFDYEMSPGSKITSNEITIRFLKELTTGCEFLHNGLLSVFEFERSYQYSRGTAEMNYEIHCTEVLIRNSFQKQINFSCRSGVLPDHFATFGTYYITE